MESKVEEFKEYWRKFKAVAGSRGWEASMMILGKYSWDVKVLMSKVIDGERFDMVFTVDKGEGAEIIRAARRHVDNLDINKEVWLWYQNRDHAAGASCLQENVIVIVERFIEEARALVTDLETLFEKEE